MLKASISASKIEARIQNIEKRLQDSQYNMASKIGANKSSTINPQQQIAIGKPNFQATLQALVKNQMRAGITNMFTRAHETQSPFALSANSNLLNMGMMGMLNDISSKSGGMNFANGLWSTLPQMPAMMPMKRFSLAHFPVQGRVSSNFDNHHGRVDPISGHRHHHLGVDIAAERGSPIQAPWSGEVVHVGNARGFGQNTVVVAHHETKQADGKILYSVFGHNDASFVSVGDQIAKGQTIATVGNEGHSTGPHLHWETRWAMPGLKGNDIFAEKQSLATNPLHYV